MTNCKWTRIITIEMMDLGELRAYELSNDLARDKIIQRIRQDVSMERGEIIFEPASFNQPENPLNVQDYRMCASELFEYAKRITVLRDCI